MIRGRKVIGIIGGMGPMATADLYRKIIENTDAATDQEHLHVLIDSNTDIPDRTACILEGSDVPLTYLIESANRLVSAGADLLIMPCNTAHHFFEKLQSAVSVPVLNMPELSAKYCAEKGYDCVGILATEGALSAGVCDPYFEAMGIRLVLPSRQGVKKLMRLIYGEVKAGKPCHPELLSRELLNMALEGAEAFLLACTELPLVFADQTGPLPFIDPTLILARAAVSAAGGKLKPESFS